jgi:glycosyltransferase involved in cell wall biosynthesis
VEYRISVITINLNNLSGLRRTVESVLLQDYPQIEYLIIDGGSKDGSLDYIKSRESQFDYWVSEEDFGIYDAMNKGIIKAKGDYLIFLNSGDYFFSSKSLSSLIKNNITKDIIYGNMGVEKEGKIELKKYPRLLTIDYFRSGTIPHPSSLIKRSLFEKFGNYNTNYKIISDWAFFLDAIIKCNVSYLYVDSDVSIFNLNGVSSQPSSYRLIHAEMDMHFKNNYLIYYIYTKLIWGIKYYPKRIAEKAVLMFKKNYSDL